MLYLTSFFWFFPIVRVFGFLKCSQKFIGTIKFAVEAPFIAKQVDACLADRNCTGLSALSRHFGFIFVLHAFGKEVLGYGTDKGVGELVVDGGGFGIDGAAVTPHTVGDFEDKMFLQKAGGFEFIEKGLD